MAEIDQGALMRIPRFFIFVMKYVAPAYLLVVLIGFSYYNLPQKATEVLHNPIALWTVIIIAAVIVLLAGMVAIGERRWRAAGMDVDGNKGVEGDYKQ